MNENTVFVILLILIVIIYMLPTVIAIARDIPQRKAVAVVNIIFGWTLIGWIGAFIWALMAETAPEEA